MEKISKLNVNETIVLLEKPPDELQKITDVTRDNLLDHLARLACGMHNTTLLEDRKKAADYLSAND